METHTPPPSTEGVSPGIWDQAPLHFGSQILGSHIRDNKPCWPPKLSKAHRWPRLSVPAELACLSTGSSAVMCARDLWLQRSTYTKCAGVCVRAAKQLRNYFQKNREECFSLPFSSILFAVRSHVALSLLGYESPVLVLFHFLLSEVCHREWRFLSCCQKLMSCSLE